MTDEASHKLDKTKKVEYIDKKGVKRTRYQYIYKRSEITEKEIEALRLGIYANCEVIPDGIKETNQGYKSLGNLNHIVCNHDTASRLIADFLRKNKGTYKASTGADLLADYLDKNEGGANIECTQGYPSTKYMFILYDYIEAPNRYLPNLITQIVGQRYHNKLHIWLFTRDSLEVVASRRNTAALLDLNYMKSISINLFKSNSSETPDLKISTKTASTEYSTFSDGFQRNVKDDPKFGNKR
jgi:hypothetical protein